jgi:EAL domain-containing protein (putative c-di-GMP-specific phosphodiesterase class I)
LAIDRNELQLHYQPILAREGKFVGFEALARWTHAKHGPISPATFIPVAEKTGLILPLSRWVLSKACQDAATWGRPLTVAVNLSPSHFDPEDVPTLIRSVLAETGLAASRLELEITEGLLIPDPKRALSALAKLRELGVQLAIDDFGTGYSSLSYLRDFPFTKIKIDQSFVATIDSQETSRAIIRAVIGLGHAMSMEIVAEGVESREQLEFLIAEGADFIQGYLIGKPAPIAGFAGITGNDGPGSAYGYSASGQLRKTKLVEAGFNYTLSF